ncbi:hypothetical protein VTK56DRAFT_32 [Thermocarpiscus australiensis]
MSLTGPAGAPVSQAEVETVVDVTGCADRAMIKSALQSNHGNVPFVINEYLDSPSKFRQKYGWDESAFSSSREGEESASGNTGPAFVVHPADDTNYLWEQPGSFYGVGAPSRPPSRANNRSPIASSYMDAPNNRQEEEDHLQRAITESLQASGAQSPQAMPPPPPPPPPLPQQSGVTPSGDGAVYFGPANRPAYDPNEWAMVPVKTYDSDPEPSLRARRPGAPVLLLCRSDQSWLKHRIGALLMIFHQIPAARNVLLQCGEPPGYGYGNKSDWWKGEPILPPGQPESDGWSDEPAPPFSEELHRLMAFLEGTERSYGTADILARATTTETNDVEKDFFLSIAGQSSTADAGENIGVFASSVEVVAFQDLSPQSKEDCYVLDLPLSKDSSPATLYEAFDWAFFSEASRVREDPSTAWMALIHNASEVFTCRFNGDDGFARPIEIPETFYLDRYMNINRIKIQELQRDIVTLDRALRASSLKEKALASWVNPQTSKTYDRRVISMAAARRCREKIAKIKNRAFWREHEQAAGGEEERYYLPEHAGEPSLLPDEAKVVAHYEAKVRELEETLAEIERVMNDTILPERRVLEEQSRKLASLLTVPSADGTWKPTYKYTLCGVVSEPNTVFLRVNEPPREHDAMSVDGASGPGENRWLRISYNAEGDRVEHTPVSYETVVREACGIGCQPILVYATDKALEQEKLPLSDALKSFVKLDNRLFKQELSQSDRLGHSPDRKRGPLLGADSESKRLQRSSSMDSMATNKASLGDPDDIPDLVDIPPDEEQLELEPLVGVPPPPPYEGDIEMETGVSPALDPESTRLAQVSLQDMNSGSTAKGPEMQERRGSPFLIRPSSGGTPGTAAEPMVLVDYSSDSGSETRAQDT